jgi:hypothetical protein
MVCHTVHMTTRPDLYRPAYRSQTKTPAEMLELVRDAYILLAEPMNLDMSHLSNRVRMLTAQVLHEGYKWANNVGGLKRIAGYPWTSLGTHEVLPALTAAALMAEGRAGPPKFPHKHPPAYAAVYLYPGPNASRATHFAAFDDLYQGVVVWLNRLFTTFETEDMLKALDAADPLAYAAALKKRGYFTADTGEYGSALVKHLADVPSVPEGFGDNFFGGGLS